jgi:hypothetical protein
MRGACLQRSSFCATFSSFKDNGSPLRLSFFVDFLLFTVALTFLPGAAAKQSNYSSGTGSELRVFAEPTSPGTLSKVPSRFFMLNLADLIFSVFLETERFCSQFISVFTCNFLCPHSFLVRTTMRIDWGVAQLNLSGL